MMFFKKKMGVEIEKKKIYYIDISFEGNSKLTLKYENEDLRNEVINRIRKSIFEGKELEIGDISQETISIINAKKIIYYKKGVTEINNEF